ncbi:hypothetical protein MTO96_040537 [Rhipicephalus appendiculatus]
MAPTFFRLLAPQVLVSLCTVFQSLLDHGTVPASWKRALVTPVQKGKSKPANNPKNYRRISITSIICRTFERVLNSQLIDFLERTKFFPASQHGFRRDRSCDTALATLNQIVSHNLDNRTETDLIQLDLSNAFDTLNISLLLDKAKESGIRGCLLRWKNFSSMCLKTFVVKDDIVELCRPKKSSRSVWIRQPAKGDAKRFVSGNWHSLSGHNRFGNAQGDP